METACNLSYIHALLNFVYFIFKNIIAIDLFDLRLIVSSKKNAISAKIVWCI